MEHFEIGAGNLLADKDLDPAVLSSPQVADEAAFTFGIAVRETVGVGAAELLDVVGIIVADKGAETALVSRSAGRVGAELDAFGVLAVFLRTSRPCVHNLVGLGVVLRDDESSVEHELSKLVLVVLAVGVNSKGERVVGGANVPVV